MRTTLDIDTDVLEFARATAAGSMSIGKALSQLARRGMNSPSPVSIRSGFSVFQIPEGSALFGPDEIRAALDAEGRIAGNDFVSRPR